MKTLTTNLILIYNNFLHLLRMKQKESIRVKGTFTMKVFKRGVLLENIIEPNLVVNLGLNQIAQLISGGAATFIDTIGFGEGTSAPAAGDTALTNAYTKNVNGVTYPSTGEALFAWSLETTEGNGLAITEFGLFFDGTNLFSRKTRAAINKDSDIRLEGTWSINF